MKHKSNENRSQEKPDSSQGNSLPVIHHNCAGIDIGSKSHFVAVPCDRDEEPVREFTSFTSDLQRMVEWLKKCRIDTVALESTGVFWIPTFEILAQNGFSVKLVNTRHLKNVSGHKSDVEDCQWLQQLATFGLLRGAFRPEEKIVALRAYIRQRSTLIACAAEHIQHMQKALSQMNIQLHNVISDITGKTGMAIIRNIIGGVRDPKILASFRDGRCHNSEEIIMESLIGNYREEHVFALQQALGLYDVYSKMIIECDQKILAMILKLENKLVVETDSEEHAEKELPVVGPRKRGRPKKEKGKLQKHQYPHEMKDELIRITGVDLTKLPGIDVNNALTLIGEIGVDMSSWRSAKQFASWLGLSPGNKISGGKRLSGKTKECANRAAVALRIAASTLHKADCALGAFLRRMKMRLGSPKAITACAHKLAKQLYCTLKYGREYIEKGAKFYEDMYRERKEASLRKRATEMGFELIPAAV